MSRKSVSAGGRRGRSRGRALTTSPTGIIRRDVCGRASRSASNGQRAGSWTSQAKTRDQRRATAAASSRRAPARAGSACRRCFGEIDRPGEIGEQDHPGRPVEDPGRRRRRAPASQPLASPRIRAAASVKMAKARRTKVESESTNGTHMSRSKQTEVEQQARPRPATAAPVEPRRQPRRSARRARHGRRS